MYIKYSLFYILRVETLSIILKLYTKSRKFL